MAITVNDIDRMLAELKDKQQQGVYKKRELELKLSDIKNRIRTSQRHLPPQEYKDLCRKQGEYKVQMVELDQSITEINSEMRKKHILRNEIYTDPSAKSHLIKLRDEYMQFASDLTRVSSMRAMASKIAEELEIIIKKV